MKLLSKKHFLLGVASLFISSAIFAQADIPLSKCDITVINKTTNTSVKTSDGPATAIEPGQQGTFSSHFVQPCTNCHNNCKWYYH